MTYSIFALDDGRIEVRCTSGETNHIAYHGLGETWTVEEDPEHWCFRTRAEALDRARLLAHDQTSKKQA
jgi:hypothetical protein